MPGPERPDIVRPKNVSLVCLDCGFNRSLQHLNSNVREGDVENVAKIEDQMATGETFAS